MSKTFKTFKSINKHLEDEIKNLESCIDLATHESLGIDTESDSLFYEKLWELKIEYKKRLNDWIRTLN